MPIECRSAWFFIVNSFGVESITHYHQNNWTYPRIRVPVLICHFSLRHEILKIFGPPKLNSPKNKTGVIKYSTYATSVHNNRSPWYWSYSENKKKGQRHFLTVAVLLRRMDDQNDSEVDIKGQCLLQSCTVEGLPNVFAMWYIMYS